MTMTFCRTLILFICASILHGKMLHPVFCADDNIPSQASLSFTSPIRRLLVPANQPDSWPPGDWNPVQRQDYEGFLSWRKEQQPGPKSVQVHHVQYTTILAGSTLQLGTFSANISNSKSTSQLMSLGQMNLAVTSLAWKGNRQKVIWGETGSGNTMLLVPPGKHTLNGTWSLQGKQRTRSVQFDLRFIPSAVNRMNIVLPVGHTLKSTSGEIVGPLPAKQSGTALWRVEPGSETTCRLTIQQTDTVTLPSSLVLMRHHISFVARRDEISFQADLSPQVYHRPAEQLLVNISKGLTIHTVTYGGDFPLDWRIHNKKKLRQLEIKLTDPLLGTGRPIRIEGTISFSEYREQALPSFQYPHAFFLEGTLHLQIDSPMKLRSYRQQGYLQTGAVFDAVAGETATFQQYQPDAKMIVQIGPPPLRIQGRLVSRLEVSDDKAELYSWLDFDIQKGNTFSLECKLPRHWNITHVAPQQIGKTPPVAISDWNVMTLKNGNQLLRIEFRDAIVPGTKHRIFIQARRNHVGENSVLQLPFMTPQNIDPLEGWIVIEHSSSLKPRWEKLHHIHLVQNAPQNVERPSLPKQAKSPLKKSPSSTKMKGLFLKVEGDNASGQLRFEQQDATTSTNANNEEDEQSLQQAANATYQQTEIPVWGRLQTRPGEPDQNEMTYQFPAIPTSLQTQLTLPANAIFGQVSINGEVIDTLPETDGTIRLPVLPKNQTHSVSIRYSVKSKSNWFGSQHDILLPHINHHLVNLHWHVTLTNNQTLVTETKKIEFHSPALTNSISWMNRYLGPIGRKATSTLFNPFSTTAWKSLFADQKKSQQTIHNPHHNTKTPAGWVIYQTEVSNPPEHLKLSVQNQKNIHAFAWLCFWGSLLGGIILRRINWRWRASVGTFWLVANIILAHVISSSIAEIFGANIAGTLLAILIPFRLVQLSRKSNPDAVPVGSTVTYLNVPSLLLLFSFIIFSVHSFAADQPDVSAPRKLEKKNKTSLPPTAMIPVDTDRQPAGNLPVIYLNQPLMQQFDEYLRQQKQTPQYLISQAYYGGKILERKEITFVAKYEIVLLENDEKKDVLVHLPITNANLGGSNACLVDGKPHPILRHEMGVGYLVKLTRDINTSSPPKKGGQISTRQITLQLHPHLVSTEEGTELQIKIPPVVKSQLSIETGKNIPIVRLVSAIGKVITKKNKTELTAELGKTETLRVIWRSNNNGSAAVVQSKVEISPATVVELHPSWIHVRSLIRTHIVKGKIGSLHLKLPEYAVLKDVVTNLQYEQSRQQNPRQETLLSIDFSEAQDKDFQVEVVFDLPLPKRSSRITIPPLNYFSLSPASQTLVSQKVQYHVSSHLMAVYGPKEFKVIGHQSKVSNVSTISVESFLNDVPGFSGTRNLALAFSMTTHTPLSFQLQPKSSVSTVYTNQTVLFDSAKMTWTFTAEVETKDVPAYRHRIQIDPRLLVQSISVKEDEAERLVRWSRKGSVVTLVLNGQTLGTQDIAIQGEMRIPGSGICKVPLIHFEEATVAEANLHIYHTKDVGLLPLSKQLKLEKEKFLKNDSLMLEKNATFYGKMVLKPTSKSPLLRVFLLNHSNSKAILLTKIQTDTDQQLQVDTFIQIPRSSSSENRQPFQLRTPKQWGDDFLAESEECKIEIEKKDNGSHIVTCTPLSSENTSPVFVYLRKTMPSFTSGDINKLAVVELLISGQMRNHLLIPRDTIWKVTNKQATEVNLSSLETSFVQKVNPDQSSSPLRLYQMDQTIPWEIETSQLGMSHEILSFHTEINIQEPGMIYGRTKIVMISKNPRKVQLSCPTGINLLGLIINGHTQKLDKTSPQDNSATEFFLPVSVSHQVNRILLVWSLPFNKQPAKDALLFPVFKGAKPRYQTITYHSLPNIRFTTPESSSIVLITPFRRDLLELLELTETLKKQASLQREVLPLGKMLIHSFDHFNRQYRIELQGALEKKTEGQLDDIQAMVATQSKGVERSSKQKTPDTNLWVEENLFFSRSSADALVYQVFQNKTDLPTVGIYHRENNFVVVALVIVLFLIAFPLAHWLFRLESHEWFSHFPMLGWGLGALFWWSCLMGSFGGFCLILFVMVVTLWNHFSNRGQQHTKPM